MAVQTFEILFADADQNRQAVYRSGQLVCFNIHVKLEEPVKCRAIYASLYGSSDVHWTESRTSGSGKSRRNSTVHYRSEEVYFDQKVAVFTSPSDGPSAEHHPAGEYYYPVTFQLPPTAPSSFEGGVGKIRYYIRANIDRPWRFDTTTQKMYTVIRDLDLNAEPAQTVGPHSSRNNYDVNFCLCFNCCNRQVQVNVELAKRGFAPGEEVCVRGEIVNTSGVDLESVNMELYQKILFHAGGKTRTTTRVAASVQLPGPARQCTQQLDCRLPVLPLPCSRIDGCNNIEVHYFLRLVGDGGCCLSVKEECCMLIIGSIPIWASLHQSPQPTAPDYVPPPPSYEECMFGRQDVDLADGSSSANQRGQGQQLHWAPSYPVYHQQSGFGLPPVG